MKILALFSFGKKKREPEVFAAPGALPVDQVLVMRQQNYTDDQIVQNLQSQGYNSAQIFDAINQANIGSSQQQPQYGYGMQQQMPMQQQQEWQQQMPMQQQEQENVDERIEEIAEAIIDEKWKELVADIKKVIEWKERTEARIIQMEQQMKDLIMEIETLHKNLLGKISQYDQNIVDVGTEVKAMEKVFQQILPSLTENINKLERMTKDVKPGPKK